MPPRTRARRHTPAPVSDSLERLGDRIRKARVEAGLSQAQVGAPHFTRAYISALELGKVRPAMNSLEFLAEKLGKPISYFVEDEKREREQRERELDIREATSLLSRATAAEALTRVLALLETATTQGEIARLRLMAGTAHNFLADAPSALRELSIAERLATQGGDPELRRAVTHQMAIAFRTSGDSARARDILLELLRESDAAEHSDQMHRLKLLRDLGAVSWDLGEHEIATAYYESALVSANEIGDVAGLVAIYNGLAYTRRSLGDLEGATSYLQRALGASQVSNDLGATAILHNALAVIAAERGHLEAADRHADRALELAKVAGPSPYMANYLNTKADCLLRLGKVTEAERVAREAMAVSERHVIPRAGAAARVVLSDIALRADQFDEAIARLEEAAATYKGLGAKQELGDVLIRLAGVAKRRGDLAAAERYAADAYRATRAANTLMGS